MFRFVIRKKIHLCEGGQALEQATQGSGHGLLFRKYLDNTLGHMLNLYRAKLEARLDDHCESLQTQNI